MRMAKTSCRWSFDLSTWTPTSGEWCRAMQCLQLEERQRIHRFKYKQDAKASLVGRLMIQKWTQQILVDQQTIIRSDRGRPLSPNSSWDFNVSHDGNFTVFVAQKATDESKAVRVGVDVMRLSEQRFSAPEKQNDFFKLMQRKFSQSEWEEIRNPQFFEGELSSRQAATFFRHWCLKESFSKGIGHGVNMDFQGLHFKIRSPLRVSQLVRDTTLMVNEEIQNEWVFEESLLDPDHCVCVAMKGTNTSYEFQRFEHIGDIFIHLKPFIMQETIEDWTDYEKKYSVKHF